MYTYLYLLDSYLQFNTFQFYTLQFLFHTRLWMVFPSSPCTTQGYNSAHVFLPPPPSTTITNNSTTAAPNLMPSSATHSPTLKNNIIKPITVGSSPACWPACKIGYLVWFRFPNLNRSQILGLHKINTNMMLETNEYFLNFNYHGVAEPETDI